MNSPTRIGLSRTLAALAALCAGVAARADAPGLEGEWRIAAATPAPWSQAPAVLDRAAIGRRVRVGGGSIAGGDWISCGGARLEATAFPADALFQGNLPAPAATAARDLGFAMLPAPGVSLGCDSGLYEFHFADAESVLVALDNVIWTLSRAPGALAEPGTPEAAVEALLEAHFGGEMAFDAGSLAVKQAWLGSALRASARGWLERPQPPDEVPAINGDPFTDSQEYPTRFAVGSARVEGRTAEVAVRFADGWREYTLRYRMQREEEAWRLVDIVYPGGDRFTDLLE